MLFRSRGFPSHDRSVREFLVAVGVKRDKADLVYADEVDGKMLYDDWPGAKETLEKRGVTPGKISAVKVAIRATGRLDETGNFVWCL